MHFSRKIALAIRQAIPCKRIGMTVVGLDVPHAHIHLIPLDVMDDIRFQKKVELSSEEMKKTAESITSFLIL
jgi:histidine triad (HIT) family protein